MSWKKKFFLSAICHVCCFNHCCLWAVDKQKIKFFLFAYLFVFCNLTRHQQIYAKSLTFYFYFLLSNICNNVLPFHPIVLYACCWLPFIFIFFINFIFFPFILQLTLSVKILNTQSIQGWVFKLLFCYITIGSNNQLQYWTNMIYWKK